MAADPRVRYVITLIEQQRREPPSTAELSRAVNLSPAHLARLFRRETGVSPACFGRVLRLDYARKLLQNSFLTVKQVMDATGWNDPSHFSREFKRRHGQSPRAFRRAAMNEGTDEIERLPGASRR
jgi:transcriptional regulator GlxA family with amidase domain